jgi:hypothetical protein
MRRLGSSRQGSRNLSRLARRRDAEVWTNSLVSVSGVGVERHAWRVHGL